jgi:hypothetical protein
MVRPALGVPPSPPPEKVWSTWKVCAWASVNGTTAQSSSAMLKRDTEFLVITGNLSFFSFFGKAQYLRTSVLGILHRFGMAGAVMMATSRWAGLPKNSPRGRNNRSPARECWESSKTNTESLQGRYEPGAVPPDFAINLWLGHAADRLSIARTLRWWFVLVLHRDSARTLSRH